MSPAALARHERALVRELGWGSAVSAATGCALMLTTATGGSGDHRPVVRAFARQTLLWATVDAAIAGAARARLRRPPTTHAQARQRARRLRTVLGANAILDVGYLALGTRLLRRGDTHRGDGLAIVIQGGFLFVLDTRHWWRVRRLINE